MSTPSNTAEIELGTPFRRPSKAPELSAPRLIETGELDEDEARRRKQERIGCASECLQISLGDSFTGLLRIPCVLQREIEPRVFRNLAAPGRHGLCSARGLPGGGADTVEERVVHRMPRAVERREHGRLQFRRFKFRGGQNRQMSVRHPAQQREEILRWQGLDGCFDLRNRGHARSVATGDGLAMQGCVGYFAAGDWRRASRNWA